MCLKPQFWVRISDISHKSVLNLNQKFRISDTFWKKVWNPNCLETKQLLSVWNPYIADNHCTVDVRNPDVWISAFSKSVRLLNRPVFRHYLKTGHKRPVIGRPVHSTSNLRYRTFGSNRFQPDNQFQTGSKPVWNWFWTSDNRILTSGYQAFDSNVR